MHSGNPSRQRHQAMNVQCGASSRTAFVEVRQDRQVKQETSPLSIFRKREMALKLPHHAGDHFEAQTASRLIDVESFRKAGAVVGDFDVKDLTSINRGPAWASRWLPAW